MKRRPLWVVSVGTSAQIEDAVAERLSANFAQPAAIHTDLKTGKTTVSLYLEHKPDWSKKARAELSATLKETARNVENPISLKLELTKLQMQDWAEAWKRHFKPLTIGSRLLIRPTWIKRQPKAGQVLVELDPGMSFGTGQHPTTEFCLRELARFRRPKTQQSFLDIGTGSGILAVCAAKLGFRPVDALDLDPDSVRVARANMNLNGVQRQIRLRCQDVTTLPKHSGRQYSLVCANLIANLLIAEANRLSATVQPGGHLVLAGILKAEFLKVRTAYESLGLKLSRSRVEKEWQSGCFVRRF